MDEIFCPSCGNSDDIFLLEEAMKQDPRLTNLVQRSLSIKMFEIPLSAPYGRRSLPLAFVFLTLSCFVSMLSSMIFEAFPGLVIPDWVIFPGVMILLLGMLVLSIAISRPLEVGIIYAKNQRKIDLILKKKPKIATDIWICKSENLLFNSKTGRSGSRTTTGIKYILRTPRK